MRLLITRPEPDATRTAQALRQRGHEVLVSPLLSVQTIDADFAGPYGAVLMSSAEGRTFTSNLSTCRENAFRWPMQVWIRS